MQSHDPALAFAVVAHLTRVWLAWAVLPAAGICQGNPPVAVPESAMPRLPQDGRPLEERFAEPPASARILKIIHKQPDDPAAQDRLLRQLAASGFGGMVTNVAFDGYLEDESKWPAFLRGVQEAKKAGMSLWLYDERGYPSGSAGDLTLRGHPEWAARGLLVAEAASRGGAEVSLELPPGKLVLAVATPAKDGIVQLEGMRDLASQVADRKLHWKAPAGEWHVFAMTEDLIFENTHAALSLAMKFPCINLLEPEPTQRFLEVTHDRYAARLGENLGKYFVATFTDEPSLMNLWFKPSPYRVLPWVPGLAAEFEKRRGRSLLPLLPALVADAGSPGARARYDFWQTIGELVAENYFGQIQAWCQRHHLASGGHLLMEENLLAHVPLYGDFFRCARRLDAPGIDCLTSMPQEVPWRIARMLSSVADLEGRKVTMCETSDHAQRYRSPGDTRPVRVVTEDEIRGTCNRLLYGGINTITSYYSFAGLDPEALRRLNLHVGRCATLLAGGHQVAGLAVVYPVQSVWPVFTPAHRGATDSVTATQVEQGFRTVTDALYAANRDFTFVDARALGEAKPAGEELVHQDLRWRAVVLPATSTLPLAAWENLAQFWRGGGAVMAVGALPRNSETEFPSARVQALAAEMFGAGDAPHVGSSPGGGLGVYLPTSMAVLLPPLLDRLLERDGEAGMAAAPIRTTHRRVDGHDVYFVANDSAGPWEGTLSLRGKGVGECWDPATGERGPVADPVKIPLKMGPYGALLYRFREAAPAGRRQAAAGALPAVVEERLPEVSPRMGKGEFVQAELRGDAAAGWRAAATLKMGAVDTHLFLTFDYSDNLDLVGAQGLAFDTSVPAGQRADTQLLVMLHERGGADYIASSGRLLGGPARAHTLVLFSQFHLAGWSKDGNGRLDLGEVNGIRVGWGGYYGAEGEQIEFQTCLPRRFALK